MVLDPTMRIASEFARQENEPVIAPLPRAEPRAATVGAWQSLATWSTLFVFRAARASFMSR